MQVSSLSKNLGHLLSAISPDSGSPPSAPGLVVLDLCVCVCQLSLSLSLCVDPLSSVIIEYY